MNRTNTIPAAHFEPARADARAVKERQREAGRTRKAIAILEHASQRPCAADSRGRRVVDARTVRVNTYVG